MKTTVAKSKTKPSATKQSGTGEALVNYVTDAVSVNYDPTESNIEDTGPS
jgi:hypothetical protein